MVYSCRCLLISIYMHIILFHSLPCPSPLRHLRLYDGNLSDSGRPWLISKATHHLGRERKPCCFINTNTSRHSKQRSGVLFLKFFVIVTASHFPIGHRIAAHLFHISSIKGRKKRKKNGRRSFPMGPN